MTTKHVPKKPEEKRAWLQYQLKLRGSSFAKVARRAGVTRKAVSKAAHNPSERLANAFSAELELPAAVLWPERYAA